MEALRYLSYLKKDGWVVTSNVPFVNIPNYPDQEELNKHLAALPHCVSLNVEELAKHTGSPLWALEAIAAMMDSILWVNMDVYGYIMHPRPNTTL